MTSNDNSPLAWNGCDAFDDKQESKRENEEEQNNPSCVQNSLAVKKNLLCHRAKQLNESNGSREKPIVTPFRTASRRFKSAKRKESNHIVAA